MFKTEQEKKEFMQKVLDLAQYNPTFKNDLETMMSKYKVPESIKLSHNVRNFNYKQYQ